MWSILPPKDSIWSCGSRPSMGNLGRVKPVTSIPERTLRLSQTGLLLNPSVEASLQHKFIVGAPQSTDFCFYQQYLLLRRILKWALPQKTLKFIISLKRNLLYRWMTTRAYQHRKVSSSQTMTTELIYTADDSLANVEWTAKWGGCWQRTRTSSDGQSQRQWSGELKSDTSKTVARGAYLLFSRILWIHTGSSNLQV